MTFLPQPYQLSLCTLLSCSLFAFADMAKRGKGGLVAWDEIKYDSEVRTVEAFNKFVEETIGAGVN